MDGEEEDVLAEMKTAKDSARSEASFTDVVSDLEAHRARELSLLLQNERLRSIVRQNSVERERERTPPPPISPRQNAASDVTILSIGQGSPYNKRGKIVFGVGLMTILPIQASFSVAEYVGYRIVDSASAARAAEESVWEKGRALFDSLFGSTPPSAGAAAMGNGTSGGSGRGRGPGPVHDICWEVLWKKSVGTGSLCRITLQSTQRDFLNFEALIKEWATAPSATDTAAAASSHGTPGLSSHLASSMALEPAFEDSPEEKQHPGREAEAEAEEGTGAGAASSAPSTPDQRESPPRAGAGSGAGLVGRGGRGGGSSGSLSSSSEASGLASGGTGVGSSGCSGGSGSGVNRRQSRARQSF